MTEPNVQLSPEAKALPKTFASLTSDDYTLVRLGINRNVEPGVAVQGVNESGEGGQVFLPFDQAARLRDFLCQHFGPPTQTPETSP